MSCRSEGEKHKGLTSVISSCFSVKQEGPTSKVSAKNDQGRLFAVFHLIVDPENGREGRQDFGIVEVKIGENDERSFVFR